MLVVSSGIRATSGVITASAIVSNGIRVASGVITASASS